MVFKVDRIGIGVSNPSQNLDVNGGCKFTGPNIYLDWHNDQRVISSANNNYRQGYHFQADTRIMRLFSTTGVGDSGGAIAFSTRVGAGSSDTDYGTERMRIDSSGNVGIGTTSPACRLDIAGEDVMIRGNTPSINFSEGTSAMDGSFRIRYDGANVSNNDNFLAVQTGSNFAVTSLHMTYDGNVGIGTTSPRGKLDIYTASTATAGLIIDRHSSDHYRTEFYQESNGLAIKVGDSSAPSEIMRVTPSKIGIGTASPDYTLDVNGTTRVGNILYVGKNTADETDKSIFFGGTYGDNDYNHAVIERRVYSTGTEKQELLLFSGNDGETAAGPDRIRLKGGQILFDVLNNSTDRTTENTKMIIKANGDVGIGTTTPDEKLEVRGHAKISDNDTSAVHIDKWGTIRRNWYDGNHNTNHGSGLHFTDMAIFPTDRAGTYNDGGVTFGHSDYRWSTVYTKDVDAEGGIIYCDPKTTTKNSPTSTGIDVNNSESGDATITLRVEDSNAGDPFISFDIANEYGWSMGIDNSDDNKFKLARKWHNIASDTALTVSTGGNLGINDTSPGYKLSVGGSFRVHGSIATFGSDGLLHINSRSTTHGSETVALQTTIDGRALTDSNPGTHGGEDRNVIALQPDGGRVGVGTINPGYKFHVAGDIYATSNITAYSDRRAKSNIEKIKNPLEKINKISGYTYTMKTEDNLDKRYTGLIAQEVLEILPEAVAGSEETQYSLAYGNMVGILVEAIKELKLEIDELKRSR